MTEIVSGSGTVDNGRRAPVTFGDYAGVGGIVERDGAIRVSFLADPRKLREIVGAKGTIDGQPYRVLSVVPSEHAPRRMVVLTVQPIPAS